MALTGGEHWDSGFVRDSSGNLSVIDASVAVGVTEQGGFLRDSDGRIVVAGASSYTPLTWNGSDYIPTAAKALSTPKEFRGPTDPSGVSGVVLNTYDTWIQTS